MGQLADWKTRHNLLEQEVESLRDALNKQQNNELEIDDMKRNTSALERQLKSWEDSAKTILARDDMAQVKQRKII